MKFLLTILFTFCIFLSACVSVNRGPKKAFTQVSSNNLVFDAIIVPGVPYEDAALDSVMKARVIWAYVLYKNGITRNVIFSGSAVYSPYYEALIMGLYAKQLGIPAKSIYYDTQARHSTENVYYSYLLAKDKGFKKVALATDPFQSRLLTNYTGMRFGSPIYHLPFIMDSVRKYNHIKPEFDPKPAAVNNFSSITDDESRFKRLFGTLGAGIDWKQYKGGQLPPL